MGGKRRLTAIRLHAHIIALDGTTKQPGDDMTINFARRVMIHQNKEVPTDERYCIVLLHDGDIQKAFYNDTSWIFSGDFPLDRPAVKAWFYVEDLFEKQESVDIREFVDDKDGRI